MGEGFHSADSIQLILSLKTPCRVLTLTYAVSFGIESMLVSDSSIQSDQLITNSTHTLILVSPDSMYHMLVTITNNQLVYHQLVSSLVVGCPGGFGL